MRQGCMRGCKARLADLERSLGFKGEKTLPKSTLITGVCVGETGFISNAPGKLT